MPLPGVQPVLRHLAAGQRNRRRRCHIVVVAVEGRRSSADPGDLRIPAVAADREARHTLVGLEERRTLVDLEVRRSPVDLVGSGRGADSVDTAD